MLRLLICLLITITIIRGNDPNMLCIPPSTYSSCLTPISPHEKIEVNKLCGKKSPRLSHPKSYVVDGQEIKFNSAPWSAAIINPQT
jgi:hypothetical protein